MRLLRRSADASLLATTIIFPSLRASRRSNPYPRVTNDLARLSRRSADASLLATTTIFPSLRDIFRPSLRASRRGNPSLPSLNDLAKIAIGYWL